ncbi:hypothetical protein DFP72DRAFT_614406 [Ephemerocybe angulata]|uniref:Peptide hydrolase n=1 Tax=Ephemerocybe angulata TaxID=980116 RepID=A0A8H6LYV9_9AGAR|nr:hypothetical protein DFP72DRAFT_614406 [Tulosesus angulatus]
MSSSKPSTRRWGPLRSLLFLSTVLLGAPLLAYRNHTTLPTPLTDLVDPSTGLPQISEAKILGYAKHLSEEIGYRTVGTKEHALADTWMVEQANIIKKNCEEVVAATGRKLECEVSRQEGSGHHRFDMMGKRLYKTYVNLSNIVVRISDGTDEGKAHALLLNAHLDSTLPSPGAADDALSVGVMLECMRVLVNTPGWSPKHAAIFLFNNAEESLQDASHLFSTQHPWAPTARAVINLEAAGTTGRELLFQATSEQMIDAYSHVPRPYGTVFANEIFSSGIILSDTDFRQFDQYLNISGLDMAIVGNSYLYHMRKDLVENIEVGVAQHMGENTLALIKYMTGPSSSLEELAQGPTPPRTVFLTYLGGVFVSWSFGTAKLMYGVLFLASIVLAKVTFVGVGKNSFWEEQRRAAGAVCLGVVGTVVVPNIVAFVMRNVLRKSLSWFSSPFAPLALYGPPMLLGALSSQYLSVGKIHEKTLWTTLILSQSFIALALQLVNIGSGAIFFMVAVPLFTVYILNPLFSRDGNGMSLISYALAQFLPLLTSSLLTIPTLEVFVPLTGRQGAEAPADHIIACLIAILVAPALPLVIPLAHRFGKRALGRGIIVTSIVAVAAIAYFSVRAPFDDMHQKRLFVLHMENVTTSEQHLHLAASDGAPGFEVLVEEIVKEFGTSEYAPKPVVMNDHNSDWDSLYPFSAFLTPFKVPLAVPAGYVSQWVNENKFSISAIEDVRDLGAGTRRMKIKIDHPGLIWTVIAFDAHVLNWDLDDNPPDEYARHHIKEASFYGTDSYTLELTIKDAGGALNINYMGLQEKGMWPGKKSVLQEEGGGGAAMRMFEQLDGWLERTSGGTVDALLMGCVGGVVEL